MAPPWRRKYGEHRFQYATSWTESAAGRPLSLSLPFTPGYAPHRGQVVQHFFDNLLPNSDAMRRRLQGKFSTRSTDTFDLLAAAHCDIALFGQQKVLVVERFDRKLQTPEIGPQWLARLPQEDCCQALGISGDQKYESDGGPGMAAILRQLDTSRQADTDKLTFVKAQLAFWLMAATHGHAKNFSIFLSRGGGFHMTPLYDVLSVWPILGNGDNPISPRRAKLAMAVRNKNAHYHLHEIHTHHWQGLARQSGVPGAFDAMVALVQQVPEALTRMAGKLPADFPLEVFAPIQAGMLAHAKKFMDGLHQAPPGTGE